jgi:hypothetical protein
MTTMSSTGTPRSLSVKYEENENPVMASTWPEASIGSRAAKPTSTIHFSGVDTGSLNENGPLCKSGIPGRSAELFSFQVFRHRDAAALARDDRAGGLVVNHKHRFERGASLLVTELDECVDIAEADVVGRFLRFNLRSVLNCYNAFHKTPQLFLKN